MLVLRKAGESGPSHDPGPRRPNLRRVRPAVHGYSERRLYHGRRRHRQHGRAAYAQGDTRRAGPVRHWAGGSQGGAVRVGVQPLQAHLFRRRRGRGAAEKQYPDDRAYGLRQDAVCPDAGAGAEGPLCHCRRHHADRGRLCRRRRGEYSAASFAGSGFRRGAGRARHHLCG